MVDGATDAFRGILDDAVEATGETIIANGGWDPRPGSQGAAEMTRKDRSLEDEAGIPSRTHIAWLGSDLASRHSSFRL